MRPAGPLTRTSVGDSGPIYVFVSEATTMSDQARLFVFPPDRPKEGSSLGLLIDAFSNDYYKEQHRIVSSVGEGWIYYSFTNPETGRDEPKVTYLKSIDWEGIPAAIGAGIYRRDIPGTCNSEEVNAMLLDSDPSNERLMEFVRCAAMELEMKGYFAINTLTKEDAMETRINLLVCNRYLWLHAVQRRSIQPGGYNVRVEHDRRRS